MKRINAVISDEEYEWLKGYADYNGITMTHALRSMIRNLKDRVPTSQSPQKTKPS